MSDLIRIAPVVFLPNVNNIEQSFGKDDTDIKNLYSIATKQRGLYISGTPPTSPNNGDLWRDSSVTPNILKEWNGSAWVTFLESTTQLTQILNEKLGANIASASTINLTTATGNFLHITGTTTITAVTLGAGMRREVVFDGILTLTHHATNNNLPSAANITTAAGDRASYYSDGTTVYCTKYVKADGTAVSAPAVANSAEAIAGTDNTKIITPLRVRDAFNCTGTAPIYACRAWVTFNGSGTVAVSAGGNVSSVTDNSTGDYTVNFTTAMSDANYATVCSAHRTSLSVGAPIYINHYSPATGSVRILCTYADRTVLVDPTSVSVAIFR